VAVDLAPIRHRPETVREQDLRMELVERQRDAVTFCDRVERRLGALYVAAVEMGPSAEQLCVGALHDVQRYRTRATS
jgi:hypothetical protein